MTPFENLKVGSWVAVITVAKAEPVESMMEMMMQVQQQQQNPGRAFWANVDGRPYQIHAISLPFMALYCPVNRHVFPIDYRQVELQLLSESYVKTFTDAQCSREGLVPAYVPSKPYYANTEPEPDDLVVPVTDTETEAEPKSPYTEYGKAIGWGSKANAISHEETPEVAVPVTCPRCSGKLKRAGNMLWCPRCNGQMQASKQW